MNRNIFQDRLHGVNRRTRIRILCVSVANGLFFAGCLMLLYFVACFLGAMNVASPLVIVLSGIAAGAFGGLAVGLVTPIDPRDTARKIDSCYNLKDRVLTAWKISEKPGPSAMESLLLEDALRHTENVEPQRVVPYRFTSEACKLTAVFVPVFILCLVTTVLSSGVSEALTVPNETVLAILDQLQDELAEPLAEIAAEQSEDEQIRTLNEKVSRLMEELQPQQSSPRDALVTLNRMEKEITETIREFGLEARDTSLKELGQALSLADATKTAGEALMAGDYEKSAESLENADFENMSNHERQTVGNELEQIAESMQRRKQTDLAEMTQALSENTRSGNHEGGKDTVGKFAGALRKQSERRELRNKLERQLAKLELSKSQCAEASSLRSSQTPGDSAAVAQGGQEHAQSKSASIGSAQSDSPFGEETGEVATHRKLQKLTGIQGEGASETRNVHSDEASESVSGLSYENKVNEYKKRAEAVLEAEPMPFEQHQIIRRYFESLAPEKP